jgi:putative DNA primase/helicase
MPDLSLSTAGPACLAADRPCLVSEKEFRYMDCITTAKHYVENGYSVIPLQLDGSKAPIGSWKAYQGRFASDYELGEWFRSDHCGIGIVAGWISDNLHIIDFDVDAGTWFNQFWNDAQQQLPGIPDKILVVATPRPGKQVWFRQESGPPGNQVLARSDQGVLIETRGQGGFAVAVGTPPTTHATGRPYELIHGSFDNLPQLSDVEAETLLNICRRYSPVERQTDRQHQPYNGEPRPGDIFNQHADIRQLLLEAGWTLSHQDQNGTEYLVRPGKETEGHSASLGKIRDDSGRPLLHVFSSNAAPFEVGGTYDAFSVFTHLRHKGDFGAAAAAARIQFADQVASQQQQWHDQNGRVIPARGLKLVSFSTIQPREVHWLWDQRIAVGKLMILAGNPGVGKTFLSTYICSVVSTGGLFPDGCSCDQGEVLFLTAEDGPNDTLRPRLDAHGADVSRIHLVEGAEGEARLEFIDLRRHLDAWEYELNRNSNIRLIIIDPLTAFLGATDSHKDADVRAVLSPLGKMAEAYDVSVIAIMHHSKDEKRQAINSIIGSIGFVGAARMVFKVLKDPEDEDRKIFGEVKNNLGHAPAMAYRIEGQGQSGRLVWEPDPFEYQFGPDQESPSKLQEAVDWLYSRLRDGPASAKEVFAEAAQDGISERTLNRAKKQLQV